MVRTIFTLMFFTISTILSAQTIDWGKVGNIQSDTIAKKLLEPTRFMASYKSSIVQNREKPNVKTRSTTLLQVGQRYVRFADLYSIPYDSVIDRIGRGEISPMEGMGMAFMVGKKKKYYDFILQDLENKTEIVQLSPSITTYEYEENIPMLDWKIVDQNSTILGYKCQKAEASYNGRDYVAWYSPDIPLPFGPYKFGGLPGLIFRITDTKNHVDFTISGFETVNDYFPIYSYTNPKTIKTSREKARHAEKNSFTNPVEYRRSIGMIITDEQIKIAPAYKPRPYYPIELE